MHDQQTLLDGLAGDFGVLHGFALGHLGAVAFGFGFFDGAGHGVVSGLALIRSGRPATMSTTRSARAAMRWLSVPWRSRNIRPSGNSGTIPEPTSLATTTRGAAAAARAASRPFISASTSASSSIKLDSHSVRQSS